MSNGQPKRSTTTFGIKHAYVVIVPVPKKLFGESIDAALERWRNQLSYEMSITQGTPYDNTRRYDK